MGIKCIIFFIVFSFCSFSALASGNLKVSNSKCTGYLEYKEVSRSNSNRLILKASLSGSLEFVNKNTGKTYCVYHDFKYAISNATFSNDEKYLAVASDEDYVVIYNTLNGEKLRKIDIGERIYRELEYSSNDKYLLVGARYNVHIIENAHAQILFKVFPGSPNYNNFFTFNEKYLISTTYEGVTGIWNIQRGTLKYNITPKNGYMMTVSLSPDQKQIITTTDDSEIILRDFQTGNVMVEFIGQLGHISTPKFFKDGKRIVTISRLGTVYIWNRLNGNVIARFKSPKDATHIRLSNNDTRLVGMDYKGHVVWTQDI